MLLSLACLVLAIKQYHRKRILFYFYVIFLKPFLKNHRASDFVLLSVPSSLFPTRTPVAVVMW